MLTGFLLFFFYTLLFLFIIYRLSLKPSFALSFKEAMFAFLARLVTGCFYGYFFLHISTSDKDILNYHLQGLKEWALLKTHPSVFFTQDIFPSGYKTNQLAAIFSSNDSFVKDLELTLLFKLTAIFDVFSGGRYFVNVIFYNALVFCASYLFFKMMATKYPGKRNLWMLLIFYFPPLLFWTSGIRKDGLSFAVSSVFIYQIYYVSELQTSFKRLFFALIFFVLLFLMRNYVAVSFVPVVIAKFISRKAKNYSLTAFMLVSFFCVLMFFLTGYSNGGFNLPEKMAERQHAFLQLSGNSYLQLDNLNASFSSYLKVLPEALNHVFIRPYFTEAKGFLYFISLLENIFFFFCLIRIFLKPSPFIKKYLNDPLILFLLFVAIFNYIIIGYTVPFLGAIVRYKSSFEILFLIVFFQLQNTDSIDHFINKRFSKKPLPQK